MLFYSILLNCICFVSLFFPTIYFKEEVLSLWKQQNLTKENSSTVTNNNTSTDIDISVAIFGHGMAFKCLLRGLLGFQPQHSYKIHLDNTAITELGISLSYYYYPS